MTKDAISYRMKYPALFFTFPLMRSLRLEMKRSKHSASLEAIGLNEAAKGLKIR